MRKKDKTTKNCIVCDAKFETSQATNRKYCQRSCQNKADYRRLRGIPVNANQGKCLACNSLFSKLDRSKQKYCSGECYYKSNRERRNQKDKLMREARRKGEKPVSLPSTKTPVTVVSTPVQSVYEAMAKRWELLSRINSPSLKKIMQDIEREVPLY